MEALRARIVSSCRLTPELSRLRSGAKAMASFSCHGFGVTKQVRLERIVRPQLTLRQAASGRGFPAVPTIPQWPLRSAAGLWGRLVLRI